MLSFGLRTTTKVTFDKAIRISSIKNAAKFEKTISKAEMKQQVVQKKQEVEICVPIGIIA